MAKFERRIFSRNMKLNDICFLLGITTEHINKTEAHWILPDGRKVGRPMAGRFEAAIKEHLKIKIVYKD
jgi:hypothetical protein